MEKHLQIVDRKTARNVGMRFYFLGTPCKWGHIEERYVSSKGCVKCKGIREKSEEHRRKVKESREKNKETLKIRNRDQYLKNREHRLAKAKEYYKENKEHIDAYKKEYMKREEVKMRRREYVRRPENSEKRRVWYRTRYANDPLFWARVKCSALVSRTLVKLDGVKTSTTFDLIGYTNEELWDHLKANFSEGMTIENRGEWQIDHIKPVSRLISEGITDPKTINSLSNLIPMWREHNREKCDKTLKEWLDEKGEGSVEWELYSKFL